MYSRWQTYVEGKASHVPTQFMLMDVSSCCLLCTHTLVTVCQKGWVLSYLSFLSFYYCAAVAPFLPSLFPHFSWLYFFLELCKWEVQPLILVTVVCMLDICQLVHAQSFMCRLLEMWVPGTSPEFLGIPLVWLGSAHLKGALGCVVLPWGGTQ